MPCPHATPHALPAIQTMAGANKGKVQLRRAPEQAAAGARVPLAHADGSQLACSQACFQTGTLRLLLAGPTQALKHHTKDPIKVSTHKLLAKQSPLGSS